MLLVLLLLPAVGGVGGVGVFGVVGVVVAAVVCAVVVVVVVAAARRLLGSPLTELRSKLLKSARWWNTPKPQPHAAESANRTKRVIF